MATQQYKSLILVVTAVLALFAASPAIQQISVNPNTDPLTELSILGIYHNATYPFNVSLGQSYQLYLNIDNHLGSCAYYQIEIKFRNQTQPGAGSFNDTSSTLAPIGEFSVCAANNQNLELPVNVSFTYQLDPYNATQLDMQQITVNGFPLSLNSTTLTWDPQRLGFFGNLFFELWVFNDTTSAFQYDQRYVSLWFNMTD